MLFATGCRSLMSSDSLMLKATTEGGEQVNLPIEYAGPQGALPGLDALIVTLPTSLCGAGRVQISLNNANDLTLNVE